LAWYARSSADGLAMTGSGERLTYEKIADRVGELARCLLAAGVTQGDRLCVYGAPSPASACLMLAAATIGAIYVGLNPKHQTHELSVILSDAEPRLIIALDVPDRHHAEKLEAARGGPSPVVAAGPNGAVGWVAWEEWLKRRASTSELRAVAARVTSDDPVAMVHTSGSTGRPKGALLLNRGLAYSYGIQAERWYQRPPAMVSDLPINHLGWVGDHCSAMIVAGGALHFVSPYSPERVLQAIERWRATYWFTITTMLLMAVRSRAWAATDLTSLERIAWGGSAAPYDLVAALAERRVALATCYGMTETTGNVTYTDDDAAPEALCETVGRPDPRIEVRLDDNGEILVRGEILFGGYFRRPDATAAAIDGEGWLHTGDLATRRTDGNLVLAGRRHDMIKSGGYNVYPREVELALERHPEVAQAIVVGVNDGTWGEVGHAFVRPALGAALREHDLQRWARRHLANYKVPKRVVIRDELPLLAVGKVDRQALRNEALAAQTALSTIGQ
jgi:fatty-acyl-CoA synthase